MLFFPSLYKPTTEDAAIFGEGYCPPEEFPHGEWVKTLELAKEDDSDGYSVHIEECHMPATFYRVVAHPSLNSVGTLRPGWVMSTGSGDDMARLAALVARHAHLGMVGFEPLAKDDPS